MKIDYYLYTRKKSPYYMARYTFPDGSKTVQSTKTKDLQEAHKKANQFISEYITEQEAQLEKEKCSFDVGITLKEYAHDFFNMEGNHIKRLKSYNDFLNDRWIMVKNEIVQNYILPSPIAEKKIKDITADDIDLFVLRLKPVKKKTDLSANTKNKALMVLKIILKNAVKDKIINYIPDFQRVKGESKAKDILEPEELKKLFPYNWQSIYNHKSAYIGLMLAATTGARLSEILGLQVKHINFDNRSIKINQSWDTRLLKVNRFTKNKTVREIAVCDRVLSELKGFITEQGKDQDSFIFCREGTNKPYDDKFFPRHMKIAIQRAGIKVNHRYITFHSFRHGVNTYLLETYMNPFKVAAFLGHIKKNNMTAKYNKTGLKHQDDIRRYFQKLLTGQDNLVVLSKEA